MKYLIDRATGKLRACAGVHEGKGTIGVRYFFGDEADPDASPVSAPALLIVYDIPPGASEGAHTHDTASPDDAFDEFYYILEGTGQMEIDGEIVPVKAGDHVYVPTGVHHGIENTGESANLKVFLTAMLRDHRTAT